jgi:serine/threonine protein kinase
VDQERNRKIDRVFQEVLIRDPLERSACLDEACAGDDDLRREVQELLLSDEQAQQFIESPLINVATTILDGNGDYSLTGKFIGPYKITSQIGAGGMGDIYLAHDARLGRNVALKVLTDSLVPDAQFRARFMREARLASMLDHPNICTIYDIGSDDDCLYIAMQYIEGETLRRVINARPIELERLFSIGIQMGDAIAAAHEEGIIHRDIKPENVIVRNDGVVKVLDFGLAKLVAGQETSGSSDESLEFATVRTTPGLILGTISYMSPEQARGDESDERSDIWGFGCVLYEMATGRPPFDGRSKADVIGSVLKEPHLPAVGVNREIPDRLSALIDRALAKEPAERYDSVTEMIGELRHSMTESGISDRFHFSGERRPTAEQRPAGLTRYLFPLGPVVILVTGLIAYYLWSAPLAPSNPPHQRLISTFSGSHSSASFSPDGQWIAFVDPVNGISQVWIKDLSGGEPKQITFGRDAAERPRWSPLDNSIVYTSINDGTPSIVSVSTQGGEPRKIIDGGRNPNLSSDGSKLVFERGYDIWVADADGGGQRKVDGVPSTDLLLSDRMPAFSPDGSLIAFFQKSKGPIGDYWLVPAAGGAARQLTFDDSLGGAPTWSSDGKFVIFPSQRMGSRTLWRVPAAGGEPEAVLVSSGEDSDPEVSRDGRRLIYTTTRNSFIVTLTDAATGEHKELYRSRSDLVDPSFSPKGDKVLFFGFAETGGIHLFSVNSDGSGFDQLTTGKDSYNIHPRWSADGMVVYYYHQRPHTSFRKLALEDGRVTDLAKNWEWATHNHANVDPAGKNIVYTKLDRGRPVATMLYEIETGKEASFSMLLRHHRWSHDGKFIAGTDVSSGKESSDIAICPTDGTSCRKLTGGYDPHWSSNDSVIYFKRDENVEDGAELWSIAADGSNENHIIDLRPMQAIGEFFDVSPSGQIVWVKHEGGRPQLWLLDFSE